MTRVVIDTNVLVSAYFWRGVPGRLFDFLVNERYRALCSVQTLTELDTVLARPRFVSHHRRLHTSAQELADGYRELAVIVEPAALPENVVRDSKDRAILACAVGGRADAIVTGDKDLLDLGSYAGIPILTPADFLDLLSSEEGD